MRFRIPVNGTPLGFQILWNPEPIRTFSERTAEGLMNVLLYFKIKENNFDTRSVAKGRNLKEWRTLTPVVMALDCFVKNKMNNYWKNVICAILLCEVRERIKAAFRSSIVVALDCSVEKKIGNVVSIYSGSKNYPSTLYNSFLSVFFALWKPTQELLLVTSCSTLCLVYMLLILALYFFEFLFSRKRKRCRWNFDNEKLSVEQRKCRLCVLKSLLIRKNLENVLEFSSRNS